MCSKLTILHLIIILTRVNYLYTNNSSEMRITDIDKCSEDFTTSQFQYKAFPIEKIQSEEGIFLPFFVKAGRDAYIIFSHNSKPVIRNEKAYEIVIGSYYNTNSKIQSRRLGNLQVRHVENGILSQEEWRQFWIQIRLNGEIQVGKGNETAFMTWKDPTPMQINHYGFSSLNVAEAEEMHYLEWSFPCLQNINNTWKCHENFTTNLYNHSKTYPIEEIQNETGIFLEFSVKGWRNAHIIFAPHIKPNMQYEEAYEIAIGAMRNTISQIRYTRFSTPQAVHEENQIMSNHKWSHFWIRISLDGEIQVGKRNEAAFMTWKHAKPMRINHYAFLSWNHNEIGITNKVEWFLPCTQKIMAWSVFANTIVGMLRTTLEFQTLRNSYENWYFYEYQDEGYINRQISPKEKIRVSFIVQKSEICNPHSGYFFCDFYDTFQVNTTQNYEKILVEGNFIYEYETKTKGSVLVENNLNVSMKNSNFLTNLILKTKKGAKMDYHTDIKSEEVTMLISPLKNNHRLDREKRLYLSEQIFSCLMDWIQNRIKNSIKSPISSIFGICKDPLETIKTKYSDYVERYFIVAGNRINTTTLPGQSRIIINGLWHIKSINVWYCGSHNYNMVYELRIEDLKGNMVWTQNPKKLTEINFTINYILLTVSKTSNIIDDVKIKCGNFLIAPVSFTDSPLHIDQETSIIKGFESMIASVLKKELLVVF